ncbi:MAG: hypothetical protein GXO77_12190 [Calditrichaeota bacterium]|nr:hypothetical protein [Calditrichota bacterium]
MIPFLPVFVFLSVLVLINPNALLGSLVKAKHETEGVSIFSKGGNTENADVAAAFTRFVTYPDAAAIKVGNSVIIRPAEQRSGKLKRKNSFVRLSESRGRNSK